MGGTLSACSGDIACSPKLCENLMDGSHPKAHNPTREAHLKSFLKLSLGVFVMGLCHTPPAFAPTAHFLQDSSRQRRLQALHLAFPEDVREWVRVDRVEQQERALNPLGALPHLPLLNDILNERENDQELANLPTIGALMEEMQRNMAAFEQAQQMSRQINDLALILLDPHVTLDRIPTRPPAAPHVVPELTATPRNRDPAAHNTTAAA